MEHDGVVWRRFDLSGGTLCLDVANTLDDRPAAIAVAERLLAQSPAPLVCAGGRAADHLAGGVRTLATSISAAAEEVDGLAHGLSTPG